jgi:heat shock protein HslJ
VPRLLLLALLAVLGGCAAPADAADPPEVSGSWVLVAGEAAGARLPQPAGATATLVFEADRLSGRAFCNSFSADYRLAGDALRVTALGSTEMGCAGPVMAAESAFLTALGAVDRVVRDGDELVLTGGDGTLRFTRQVPEPDRPLVGTRWVLDTLADPETASSVLGEAVLELAPDGTATGSTGCRAWTGGWQQEGSTLMVRPVAEEVPCAPDLTRQDDQVLAVLAAAPAATVEGARLTVTAPDGRGLSYRAG